MGVDGEFRSAPNGHDSPWVETGFISAREDYLSRSAPIPARQAGFLVR